jgi:O-antigen ligase
VGPNAAARTTKAIAGLAVIGGIALASPLGDTIVAHLPFIGTANTGTVVYRQRVAEVSWMLIQQNPVFGSPYYMAYMEELRQGEGIIDLVNSYAGIALSFGLVGLALFVCFFLALAVRCFNASRSLADRDPDFADLGSALLACVGGALVIIATTSNINSIPYVYVSIAGLMFAYVEIGRIEAAGAASDAYMQAYPVVGSPFAASGTSTRPMS